MASRAANKRLTREYKAISENPPPFIVAHPSETNILEWHYILTGPPDTPYQNGQYWGTLIFPPNYPFAPPAIRMHTPSGRFQPSSRLCLSISDFHPKSFNPAWEVSTILIGLLSFMTSEEMTTGSVGGTEAERKWAALRTRWWNNTGGGSFKGEGSTVSQKGNIKAGDGGVKFRTEWPELEAENWKWMKENRIDAATGNVTPDPDAPPSNSCGPVTGLRRPSGSQAIAGAVVEGGRAVGEEGRSWVARHKLLVAGSVIFTYVLIARLLGEGSGLSV
ncbi:ubiquitin-conjugating enzyme [Amylocarpus encephaloides]|uniref:Ubiquitin-conjugating enzyme n=1 Tax=Amylocarpus encephaloides TaxID=45428 RepID=A0A9P7Y9S5_9HELO|nr:ubiquitin-conjugating enzyme [Amylocarpus encephaloides]